MTARRTCPACARRYGGLVADECVVCAGLGTLTLGPAALASHAPGAVARSVELYLELAARRTARDTVPLAERPSRLEDAVAELHAAGILGSPTTATGTAARQPPPHDDTSRRTAELEAHRLTGKLGKPVTPAALAQLHAPPIALEHARAPLAVAAHASANGVRAHLALVADPIDPLGPDLAHLAADRHAANHAARVLAGATDHIATRPRRRSGAHP